MAAPKLRELSDEEIFGTAKPGEMSDDDVFGQPQQPQQQAAPEKPWFLSEGSPTPVANQITKISA